VNGGVEQCLVLETHPVLPGDERPPIVRLDVETPVVLDESALDLSSRDIALSAPRWE
jgi:hypothetical protein